MARDRWAPGTNLVWYRFLYQEGVIMWTFYTRFVGFFFFFCLLLLNCRKGVYEYFNKEVSMEVTFVLLKYHLP